jgi:hypothetical protein
MSRFLKLKSNELSHMILKGVKPTDYVSYGENFLAFTSPQLPSNNFVYDEAETFDKLPAKFTTLELWPENTNLHCIKCSLQFLGRPILIPTNIDKKELEHVSPFCSFPCALLWINDTIHTASLRYQYRVGLEYVFKIFYPGKPVAYREPTLHPKDLKKFGGNTSESNYKNAIRLAESYDV